MRKVRIAQIGANLNSHSCAVLASLRKQSDLFEVVGYALPENERERIPYKMAGYDELTEMTVEEILSDPTIEAVAVETDEIYLTKYAQMVAESGKHIHMEKPGGADPLTFERLIDTVKEKGVVFHTGYMYRYNPYVRELIAALEAGELGEVQGEADGFPGDEDNGTMAAWYLFAVLGFYPLCPGRAEYIRTAPMVQAAAIRGKEIPFAKTCPRFSQSDLTA